MGTNSRWNHNRTPTIGRTTSYLKINLYRFMKRLGIIYHFILIFYLSFCVGNSHFSAGAGQIDADKMTPNLQFVINVELIFLGLQIKFLTYPDLRFIYWFIDQEEKSKLILIIFQIYFIIHCLTTI
jgi:hypothetical protein